MSINREFMLYSLAKAFDSVLNIAISNDTKTYIKKSTKTYNKLDVAEKTYYANYATNLAQCLSDYLNNITLFEINIDSEPEVLHDFRLNWDKKSIAHISLSHLTIMVRDIIPIKLMKICKYKRNTKICKNYTLQYQAWNDRTHKKIKNKEKYSALSDKIKNTVVLAPVCDLTVETLAKKRKCAANLFNYLFDESDRIVFKLYKNRFVMYDFGKELDEATSFGIKKRGANLVEIKFNNEMVFTLTLHTNATEIKNHISIKFRTTLNNIDETFAICSHTV